MENWKEIKGYEGSYQVSDLGKVKSIKSGKEKILKNTNDMAGYLKINLYKNGVRKTRKVHRLVLLAFKDNIEKKPHGNHIDKIRTNNRIDNLEWCTSTENSQHSSKFDWIQINVIREATNIGYKVISVANYFKVSRSQIYRIKGNVNWKTLSTR